MRQAFAISTQDNSGFAIRTPEYRPDDMRTLVNSSFCSMEYQVVPGKVSPMTHLRGSRFGGATGVGVFQHDGKGKRVGRRDRLHIRSNWVDDFVISMPISARVQTTQEGKVANLEPGSFVFLSTSKPFSAELCGINPEDAFSLFLVRISGPVLRERVPQIDDYCGCPIKVRDGAGNIMQSLFNSALSDGAGLSSGQNSRFGEILLSAITNVAVEVAESSTLPPRQQPAYARLLAYAVDYIHGSLSSPDLGTNLVASHCQVSTRYIQSVFAASSTTVEAYIREARLLQCRASLRHPALRHKAIIEIAMQWGFNDPAYFSRIYKARFGNPPSADRD